MGDPSRHPPNPTGVPSVDVTVVFYNSASHIGRLVESLAACADQPIELNLHIVDNHSDDGSIEVFREALSAADHKFAGVTIHESASNLGFGRAQNRAAAAGNAPYIFVLNPDTVLPSDSLQRLLAEAARSPEDVAAWEPRQTPYEHPKAYDPVSLEPPWCSAAALLLRRQAFEKVGGLKPPFSRFSHSGAYAVSPNFHQPCKPLGQALNDWPVQDISQNT